MKLVSQPIHRTVMLVLGLWGVAGVNSAWADSGNKYNQIHLEAHSTEQVKNDRMQAVLSVFGEDQDPMSLADRINHTMEWASLCALGGLAPAPVRSALEHFPKEFSAHLRATQEGPA